MHVLDEKGTTLQIPDFSPEIIAATESRPMVNSNIILLYLRWRVSKLIFVRAKDDHFQCG